MPKLVNRCPKKCRHKATGQAYVMVNRKQIYLGKWGSKAANQAYDRLCVQYINNGRQLPRLRDEEFTCKDLAAAYLPFAQKHYVKNGVPTTEYANIKYALKPFLHLYGSKLVKDFGPASLDDLQAHMETLSKRNGEKFARRTINDNVIRIRTMFKWGVRKELVPVAVFQALKTVELLKLGRTDARESRQVASVPQADVDAILPKLRPMTRAIIQFQYYTACRPGEACMLRPCDIDQSDDVWIFRPRTHKTEHRGKERTIFIGPKAQAVIKPFLDREPESNCFSPSESETERYRELRANRKSPVYGQKKNRGRRATRAGDSYNQESLRQAVHKACSKAKVKQWNPNQLRHARATEIRAKYGLEASAVILGHSIPGMRITEIYAEPNIDQAKSIMREIG